MNCNCRYFEALIAIVVVVFSFWQVAWSQWIIVIAAALLLIHSMRCINCGSCAHEEVKVSRLSRRKKRR